MSKKSASKTEAKISGNESNEVKNETSSDTSDTSAPKSSAGKSRGPRGVGEDAVVTLIATANPKRVGSKAHAAFANYTNGMTVKAFADAVGADATGHLTYDAKHGFISIAGYDPGAIVVPKPKAEKAPKVVKGEVKPDVETQAEVAAETME